jgi:hypothetical protein
MNQPQTWQTCVSIVPAEQLSPNSQAKRSEGANDCGGLRRLRRFSLRPAWSIRALPARWTLKRPEGRAPAQTAGGYRQARNCRKMSFE